MKALTTGLILLLLSILSSHLFDSATAIFCFTCVGRIENCEKQNLRDSTNCGAEPYCFIQQDGPSGNVVQRCTGDVSDCAQILPVNPRRRIQQTCCTTDRCNCVGGQCGLIGTPPIMAPPPPPPIQPLQPSLVQTRMQIIQPAQQPLVVQQPLVAQQPILAPLPQQQLQPPLVQTRTGIIEPAQQPIVAQQSSLAASYQTGLVDNRAAAVVPAQQAVVGQQQPIVVAQQPQQLYQPGLAQTRTVAVVQPSQQFQPPLVVGTGLGTIGGVQQLQQPIVPAGSLPPQQAVRPVSQQEVAIQQQQQQQQALFARDFQQPIVATQL